MTTISILLITTACFLAAVLNLAAENRYKHRIMGLFTAVAIVAGICFYSYGFAYRYGLTPMAVLRSLLAICRMFGGINDLGSIEAAPLFSHQWALILFWAAHFMAFYVTASAAIATIGGKVLQRIRITLLRRGTLLVIYGVNANAVAYGQHQHHAQRRSVVYIGQADAALEASINASGGVMEKNETQLDRALLRRLGIRPGRRRVEIAALHEDCDKNFAFSRAFLTALQAAGIRPMQTLLLMQGVDEQHAASLTAADDRYGYGSVLAFDEYQLAARLMVQQLPPCELVHFDEHGRAQEDFSVLMIGFGRMGHAALEALLMNGQFCGSCFRADIFDANAQSGVLYDHEILRQYDIRFHTTSGKSDALYAFLNERKNALRYIVLCTGSEKENREIAWELSRWLKLHDISPAIVQCTSNGIVYTRSGEQEPVYQPIYSSDVLNIEQMDRMAMVVNHAYCLSSGKTIRNNWLNCDYFSRMSSRAFADFHPAVLKAAGKSAQQVLSGDWPPPAETLENLAIMEHMRWCAFHYVMDFSPMSKEEHEDRIERYCRDMRQTGTSALSINKNMKNRTHACLIPWEELDALSAQENAATGGRIDYKQMDRSNILVLPKLLRLLEEMPE